MKKLYLYCTRLRIYWVLIPIIFILVTAIIINPNIEGVIKLYPLILVSFVGLVFTIIYLFRMIEISYQEIRYIGRFSSRDSADITEGKTLILLPERRGVIRIKLMAIDTLPELSWMQNGDGKPRVVCMFRGKAYGGNRNLRRILRFFGVDDADFDKIITSTEFSNDYETVDVKTLVNENEQKEIHIKIKVTV